jgi:hypothetical protein
MPTRVAVARMVAEPVWRVRYQTRANCTRADPKSESDCPAKMVKNFGFQLALNSSEEISGIFILFSRKTKLILI